MNIFNQKMKVLKLIILFQLGNFQVPFALHFPLAV